MEHMRRGNFAGAWEISDAVLRARVDAGRSCAHLPRHEQWVWNGRPLAGRRVLVRCYHGLGDTVQFLRYLPWLKGRAGAAEVILWVQPALRELAATVRGVDRLLPLHDGAPDAGWSDADVEIMELPHLFRSTLETLPAEVPYLHADPAPLARKPSGRLAVGLVWRAGDWDERRSVPAGLLASMLNEKRVPGVALHLLQRGTTALAEWPMADRPADVSGHDDVTAAARVMRALDLVITVDSLPAHLAGALGVPVWTLLHADADWRWMAAHREDSPWYPTMRLFRQDPRRPGDWEPVLARVAAALRRQKAEG